MWEYLKNSLYRNTSYLILSSLLNAGTGFFFWMLAARYYSVQDVGFAVAIVSALGLVLLFSRLGFDISIIRFFSLEDRASVFNTSLVITSIASILFGILYAFIVESLTPSISFNSNLIYIFIFILINLISSIVAITGSAMISARRADYYFYQNILLALRIIFLIPLAPFADIGIFGSIGLSALIATFLALLFLHRFFIPIDLKINKEFIKNSFKYSFGNYLSNILSIAPTLILPIVILNLLGEAEAAKYYIAFSIGNLVLIIPNSLSTCLLVEGSLGNGLRKNIFMAILANYVLLIPGVMLLYFFGDILLGLFKQDYIEAFEFLRILALSSLFVPIYSFFIPIQNVRMKIGSIIKINLIRFFLLLILSYAFILKFGILGVGYAWIITYIMLTIWIAKISRQEKWI